MLQQVDRWGQSMSGQTEEQRGRSPYQDNARRTFWRSAVSGRLPGTLENIHDPKFDISQSTRIATAGSCFAQHISRHLNAHGYQVLDVEPAPAGLSDINARRYGYATYSARYGNIYHIRQLLQLIQEAMGLRVPGDIAWSKNGRYFDALRPSIEPQGLNSADQVMKHRRRHLQNVHELISSSDLLVFTLGLTEAWLHKETGTVFPTAPGTIAGDYDDRIFQFVNFTHRQLLNDLLEVQRLLRTVNPNIKILLTVSPVALAATATGQHVLVSTAYSKATLRSVAGEATNSSPDIDYFPSYEIVTGAVAGNVFLTENRREVTSDGVDCVMSYFSEIYGAGSVLSVRNKSHSGLSPTEDENEQIICEDVLLEAFEA